MQRRSESWDPFESDTGSGDIEMAYVKPKKRKKKRVSIKPKRRKRDRAKVRLLFTLYDS